jgi:hypothetical protein
MAIREPAIHIRGLTPLLMHADNIEGQADVEKWKNDNGRLPADKREPSIPGDDRTPAWRWLIGIYHDDQWVAMPTDNIARNLMEGAAMILVPGSRNSKKTFKAQSQSGMMPIGTHWELHVNGKRIPWKPLLDLRKEKHFDEHVRVARELGIVIDVRRARIGQNKHVRTRARVDNWEVFGSMRIWDDAITDELHEQFWYNGGRYRGLGDWRPGSKTPGSYGMYEAKITNGKA